MIYMISYMNDAFDLAFGTVSLLSPLKKTFQTVCSFFMLVDIVLFFFIADSKDGRQQTSEEESKGQVVSTHKLRRQPTSHFKISSRKIGSWR